MQCFANKNGTECRRFLDSCKNLRRQSLHPRKKNKIDDNCQKHTSTSVKLYACTRGAHSSSAMTFRPPIQPYNYDTNYYSIVMVLPERHLQVEKLQLKVQVDSETVTVCVQCLFLRTPSRAPNRTPSACAKRATITVTVTNPVTVLLVRPGASSWPPPVMTFKRNDQL